MSETLSKSERLCGQQSVSALFEHGKGVSHGCLRCKYILRPAGQGSGPVGPDPISAPGTIHAATDPDLPSRIVVSVPKRLFKRAVKRNLLKRRIRESYRRQKELLAQSADLLFIYTSAEVQPYEAIFDAMGAILRSVAAAPVSASTATGTQVPHTE